MPLQKQNFNINFAQGLDTKSDPFQIQPGRFLTLQNSIFDKAGRFTKRNGFGALASLPDTINKYCTTFNSNLTAIGNKLYAYSQGANTWRDKGTIQPVSLETLPLVRANTNQSQADAAVSANGLVCTVFTDEDGVSPSYEYVIADSTSGQNLIPFTYFTATKSPRVFALGNYFIIVFTNANNLKYIAVNINTFETTAPTDISTQHTGSTSLNFDGAVLNNCLYLAWNGSDGGGAVRLTYLQANLAQVNTVVYAGMVATHMSVAADASNNVAYAVFYNSGTQLGYALAVQLSLTGAPTFPGSPVKIIDGEDVTNITSAAQNGKCTFFYEIDNSYPSPLSTTPTHYIKKNAISQNGALDTAYGSVNPLVRSVGLASKAFLIDGKARVLAAYDSSLQPTYFLVDQDANISAKVAYSNGGGYLTLGLPGVTVTSNKAQIAYRRKDLIQSANKSQGVTSPNGVYTQTGVNLATFTFSSDTLSSAEIGNNLNLSGGFLWMYDGFTPVEQGFHVWPDVMGAAQSNGSGTLAAQQYYYQAIYEWSDNQGNIFRSAPSLPLGVLLVSLSDTITLTLPTLRLTYKTLNPVKIVIYRWSLAQQTYYQVTSLTAPLLNDPAVDAVTFVDTQPDSAILGNSILYTTGNVVENVAGPACSALTLFKSRLFLIDAENPNRLWYSKQVIESTPVELADLFTIFIAPTTASQGATGPIKALAPLDDKLILFKNNALYYMTGTGPDNTGQNNDFSEPNFITATVGCSNQSSIVFIPSGLMFQSDKGIWLLDRNLQTTYIGAPVEALTKTARVLSALNVPGTNQVRFTLDSGLTLVYDYFYGQWGTFNNIPALSSTLFNGLHTYINSLGRVFQETPGKYLDGSSPVLLGFTTGWLNFAGIQGFERAYEFYLLATYITPHFLRASIAYDYNVSPSQILMIRPDNYDTPYGEETVYGGESPFGGPGNLEQWRVFFKQQKCQSFQLTLEEMYDPSLGVSAGAGFTLSGLNVTVGIKGSAPKLKAKRQVG